MQTFIRVREQSETCAIREKTKIIITYLALCEYYST
jgi:hypothetical protein